METGIRYADQVLQGILAMSTQEQLGLLALSIATVGVTMFVIYLLTRPTSKERGETKTMAPPVNLKQSDKGMLALALTNGLEDRVMFHKLNRKTARRIYDAVGRALDIPELRYTAELKVVIKSRRAHAKKLNGHRLPIPGDPPVQDIKPNVFKSNSKEKAKSLFKKSAQATS